MREERGQLTGDLVINELCTLWGRLAGNVTVAAGGKFYLRGRVFGDLKVEADGRAHVLGNLQGRLIVMPGAKVVHGGIIGGDVINRGGRLYVEASATTLGKLKVKEGITLFASKPPAKSPKRKPPPP